MNFVHCKSATMFPVMESNFIFVEVLCDSSSILVHIGFMALLGLFKATSLDYKHQNYMDVDISSHSKVNALSQKLVKLCNGHFDCGGVNGCFVHKHGY